MSIDRDGLVAVAGAGAMGIGTARGGMIFALAGSASAYACNPRNVAAVAQGAFIAFLAPAWSGDRLVAEAREVMLAGRRGRYAVEVRTADGMPIATSRGLSRSIGGPVLTLETMR